MTKASPSIIIIQNMKTLESFRKVGYKVDIQHIRNYKVAYLTIEGKLVVKTIQQTHANAMTPIVGGCIELAELMAKGGRTEVIVTDVEIGIEYFAFAMCHEVGNYCKHTGIQTCLDRIVELMKQDVVEGNAKSKFVD